MFNVNWRSLGSGLDGGEKLQLSSQPPSQPPVPCLPAALSKATHPALPPSLPAMPQLNHFNLFGSGYLGDCERLATRLAKRINS